MNGSRRRQGQSRRTFLKTAAAVTAGTALTQPDAWAQALRSGSRATRRASLPHIDPQFVIAADQAWDWHLFKSECGPTYAGSVGWKRYTDFLISKIPEYGGGDLEYVDVPYDHYIVDDWPDRQTHVPASGRAIATP